MRKRNLAAIGLVLVLGGCQAIEEKKKEWRRNTAETNFVEAVGIGDLVFVRESLAEDRTLANAVRWDRSSESSRRAESALTMALKQGRREFTELLLAHGADPNFVDGAGLSPLGAALQAPKDRLTDLTLLLEKGADPARRYGHTTALHEAAGSADSAMADALRLLLTRTSRVGDRDAGGQTPLHSAARAANVPALRMLFARDADPNAASLPAAPDAAYADAIAGTTPLAIVARDRQIAAAATLCALGADPDIRDSTGASARQVAVRVAAKQAAQRSPIQVDVVRYQNMAAFLAEGGGCDALLARRRRGETIAEAEVLRIANESECGAGWGWACGQAGWAFGIGEGAPRDEALALALFRKGCEDVLSKSAWCCGMVGIYHVEGRAVPKDPVAGARWLSRGCEPAPPRHADEQSCVRLGLLYAKGSGVEKDLGRARGLFKKACDEKYERGCANLTKYATAN